MTATATIEEADPPDLTPLRQLADRALADKGLGDVPTAVARYRAEGTPWDAVPDRLHEDSGVWMSTSTIRSNVPNLLGTRVARRRRR